MCCAIAALAAIAALRGAIKPVLRLLASARWAAAAVAVAVTLAGGSGLAAYQIDRAPRQADLASFLMQHICGVHGDGVALGRGNTKR
jgi:hypothetical protein